MLTSPAFEPACGQYGYKRCASANNACKKFITDHAKTFRTAKQWAAARDYAAVMLPVARDMVWQWQWQYSARTVRNVDVRK